MIYLPNGQVLCPLHAHYDVNERGKYNIVGLIGAAMDLHIVNFDGVCFPDKKSVQFRAKDDTLVSFRDCTFGDDFEFDLRAVSSKAKVVMVNPTMRGSLVIHLPSGGFDAVKSDFTAKVSLMPTASKLTHYNFREVRFRKRLEIMGPLTGVWEFSHARLYDTLKVRSSSSMHGLIGTDATISFFGARFTKGVCPPTAEGHYRLVREAFAEVSDRDNEGLFYQLEKRCQRFGLRKGITRTTSALYDWFSSYGRSYVKPLILLLVMQLVAGGFYAVASKNYDLSVGRDPTIAAFTLAQAVKPFELFGVRVPSGITHAVVGTEPSAWWAIGTFAHALLSLALLALFLLALRWRFKRN